MEVSPGINGKIAPAFPLPSEDCKAQGASPAEMERRGSANTSAAAVKERPGYLCTENTPETQHREPSLWAFASILQGPAFPTTACNLLLMAGGRFYTDHALWLP